MRRMAMSAVSAALLLGASSFAMAAQPGASDQSPAASRTGERSPTTSGDVTTPKYDGKSGQSLSADTATRNSKGDHALSGTSAPPTDEAQVKQRLEQQGYSNVQGIHKDRDGWTANAERSGQKVTVDLDANGQVKAKTR